MRAGWVAAAAAVLASQAALAEGESPMLSRLNAKGRWVEHAAGAPVDCAGGGGTLALRFAIEDEGQDSEFPQDATARILGGHIYLTREDGKDVEFIPHKGSVPAAPEGDLFLQAGRMVWGGMDGVVKGDVWISAMVGPDAIVFDLIMDMEAGASLPDYLKGHAKATDGSDAYRVSFGFCPG